MPLKRRCLRTSVRSYDRLPCLLSAPFAKGGANHFYRGLGRSPNRFPRRGKPMPPGSGCDPTSLKWDGSYYSGSHKVCNVNNKTKLLPMGAELGSAMVSKAKPLSNIKSNL